MKKMKSQRGPTNVYASFASLQLVKRSSSDVTWNTDDGICADAHHPNYLSIHFRLFVHFAGYGLSQDFESCSNFDSRLQRNLFFCYQREVFRLMRLEWNINTF